MRIRIFCSLLLLSFVSLVLAGSGVTVRIAATNESVVIPAIESKSGDTKIALVPVFEKLTYQCTWDRFTNRLTCIRKNSKIVFTQDNKFYTVNGAGYQLSTEPNRIGGMLYLPLRTVLKEIRVISGEYILEDTLQKEKVSQPGIGSKFTVVSASIDKKQNGTLLTLVLSDSLPFDCTYFYPNLTVNFLGGTVNTKVIKQLERIGLVDSMFALQYKQSAQVSLILNREIEDPLVDYIQDTKTLLIALRQKKVKPQVKTQTSSTVKVQSPSETISVASVNTHVGSDVSNNLKTIVLDPGHGGKDPGALGFSGVMEKDVVLAIALKVRDLLKKNSKLKVLCTRDKDIFIPLSDRTKFANDNKADFFVSVHADAVPGNNKRKENTRGYKIYFLSQAKNEEDKLVAMRENAVIELEDKPQNYTSLQNVLIDMAGNEYLKESQEFCIILDQKFESNLDNKISKLHLGVGQANFWVLNGAFMPSVLIETGFLSNPDEEKLLSDKKFQAQMADAIYNAILGFQDKYGSGI